ncbi:hypothetical protein [Neotabrizicola shimadae]|uniref:Uncharacterized protein n=1 Tax=Neotabrizicola shimadae TaxID=2807096 RepID=A0A8G0ZV95_9RHOB|nr:hypothetical protein [Neotabrizicola shimadae]QYZ69531.1 hypothetical protein JO391_17695 [Neotabrizicola shimadae]
MSGKKTAKPHRTRSTARDPFACFSEPHLALIVVEDLLDGTGWSAPNHEETVNWRAYLSDTDVLLHSMAMAIAISNRDVQFPQLSIVVGVAGNCFKALRSFQNAPTAQEGFARIEEMRHAALTLSRLAKGGQERQCQQDEDASFMEAMLKTGSPGLHPFLKDLICLAHDAPDLKDASPEECEQARKKAIRRERRLVLFFDLLEEVIGQLTIPAAAAAKTGEIDSRTRQRGAPADKARDWLLIRLMWIWRDFMGKEISVYLKRTSARGANLDPRAPEGSLLQFVSDVLDHLKEPVLPHQLSGLEKKLIELRPLVPKTSLFTS